jgi:hypothetical protein
MATLKLTLLSNHLRSVKRKSLHHSADLWWRIRAGRPLLNRLYSLMSRERPLETQRHSCYPGNMRKGNL